MQRSAGLTLSSSDLVSVNKAEDGEEILVAALWNHCADTDRSLSTGLEFVLTSELSVSVAA